MLLILPSSNHMHYLGKGLDNYISNYGNMSIPGEFNSEPSKSCFSDFCDIYKLSNFVKNWRTCFKIPDKPSSTYLFLTNRQRSFRNTVTIETSFSDFHKDFTTVLYPYRKKNQKSFSTGTIKISIMNFFRKR